MHHGTHGFSMTLCCGVPTISHVSCSEVPVQPGMALPVVTGQPESHGN